MTIATPYYLIDENRMLKAMERIRFVREHSGAKSVLALKCFSTWCAFDFMKDYLVGTTSSSLYEARLGREKFGGETHGYSVAYSEAEVRETARYCDKIIFNSLGQLSRFKDIVVAESESHQSETISIGLRLNPEIGFSEHKLSDTVCEFSRLGVRADQLPNNINQSINGAMLHMNCDNDDFASFAEQLDAVEQRFGPLLQDLDWLSLGGGVAFTSDHYPLDAFCERLKAFAWNHSLQIYLEPGEASVTESTSLVVKVLDIVDNGLPTLVVDAGVETHLLDVLIYDYSPALQGARALEDHEISQAIADGLPVYRISGRTCLSGDVFGTYVLDTTVFSDTIEVGQTLTFTDAGGYSMVKKNFFNGIKMPSICLKKRSGETELIREFSYQDFRDFLS